MKSFIPPVNGTKEYNVKVLLKTFITIINTEYCLIVVWVIGWHLL